MVFFGYSARAQTSQIPSNIDFSTVNVDDISDQQLTQLVQRAQASGFTVDDILQQAQAKGMSADNVAKLKDRLNALNIPSSSGTGSQDKPSSTRSYNGKTFPARDSSNQSWKDAYRRRIFGADLFMNTNLSFEPNLTIPTPSGYVLGAGDELLIDVFGYSEKSDKVRVTPDGFVNIPNIGPVLVSGLTIEEARIRITNRLGAIYGGIKGGNTHVQVQLGDIRSIKVIVTGEVVRPGSYTLPSLATIANALYVSGGPSENGSFRNITLVRDGAVIDTFDLYRFLSTGSLAGNMILRDQDIVKVNPYNKRVILEGQVKHPAIFEARDNETLQDIIDYAGGYTYRAYTGVIKATRITDKEKEVLTIPQTQVKAYALQSGDSLYVDSVLNRFTNKVSVDGPVFFPGSYAVRPGMTVNDVIKDAAGVKEDIFMNRGLIKRRRPDFTPEVVSFNVGDVLSGAVAVPVQAEDSIILYSKFGIRQPYFVYVTGEVNKPDSIPYLDGMRVEDAILLAGGFKDAASWKEIEVARRERSQEYDPQNKDLAIISKRTVPGNFDRGSDTGDFILAPFDRITVRRAPGYKEQGMARVDGDVVYPGEFVISSKSERLSNLIDKAGGLKLDAYAEGAMLLRKKKSDESEKYFEQNKQEVFKEANKGDDSVALGRLKSVRDVDYELVDINLEKALQLRGSKYDLLLQNGDIVRVPQQLQTVSLNGEVFYPKLVRYDARYRFKDFIYQAGGFTSDALKRRSYVVYPNGGVEGTRKFLFFNHFPKVKPGSEIYVPAKRRRPVTSTAEVLGLTSGFAALLGIIISIITITK
jgi:protein involved in polysaccharide export with SLBB domain